MSKIISSPNKAYIDNYDNVFKKDIEEVPQEEIKNNINNYEQYYREYRSNSIFNCLVSKIIGWYWKGKRRI